MQGINKCCVPTLYLHLTTILLFPFYERIPRYRLTVPVPTYFSHYVVFTRKVTGNLLGMSKMNILNKNSPEDVQILKTNR